MASDWPITNLDEVAITTDYVANGSFASLKDNVCYRLEPDFAVLVRTVDFNNSWNGDFVWVDKHAYEFLSKSRLEPGDLVLSNVGSVGIVFRVPDLGRPMTLGPNAVMCRTRDRARLDQRFLYYYFSSREGQQAIRAITSGSVQPKFNKTDFRSLNICLPPIPEQRAIAHILGTLDDKIELNRRMNETLEAMARALFKSWFVDFAPVRAKAEGRWKRGQSLPGLPANFYDLFPGSFEDSELGEIPKGWRMTRLADVLKESNERVGNLDVPEYSSTNNGLQLRSERYKKTLSVSSSKNKLIRKGFLVFGLSRRVLNFGLMRDEIGSVSSAYKVFKVNEYIVYSDLLERLMRLRVKYFYNAVSSSSREGQSISAEGLGLLKIVLPPRNVQVAFYTQNDSIAALIQDTKVESRILAAMHDTLLPKLISGGLRVQNANKFIGSDA